MAGPQQKTKDYIKFIKEHKHLKFKEIASLLKISKQYVSILVQQYAKDLGRKYKNKKIKPEIQYLSDLEKSQHARFTRKKQNAKKTGYSWTVSLDDITWPIYCPILKLKIDYFSDFRTENSPSFDRINNNLGYIPGNVHIISWRANRIKNDGTAEEHRKIADYLDAIVIIDSQEEKE